MLEFVIFFGIGLILYPCFSTIYTFLKIFFRTNSILKTLNTKVKILAYDYKVFMLRKDYAEENSIGYTTPFPFNYSDEKVKIEMEPMSQIQFLNKMQNLENDVDEIVENLDFELKTTEPALSVIKFFYSLKDNIREANPYA